MDNFIALTEARRLFTDAIGHHRILNVRYAHPDEEEAHEYRLAPLMMGGATDETTPEAANGLFAYSIPDSHQPRRPLPRVLCLDVGRFISIENTAGVFDPRAPGRDKELAQLERCLELMLTRFRSCVPSIEDLEDCRASVLARVWNKPIVGQLVVGDRLDELKYWLHRCIQNDLRNRHRSRRREAALRARAAFASSSLMSPFESIDFNLQLQQTIDRLQPYQARLVSLAYVEGLSPEEIASLEHRTVVAVRRAISRARQAIRDRWDLEER